MTHAEIKAEIEKIEKKQFYLNMADHWSEEDYELDRRYTNELISLRTKLDDTELGVNPYQE